MINIELQTYSTHLVIISIEVLLKLSRIDMDYTLHNRKSSLLS